MSSPRYAGRMKTSMQLAKIYTAYIFIIQQKHSNEKLLRIYNSFHFNGAVAWLGESRSLARSLPPPSQSHSHSH